MQRTDATIVLVASSGTLFQGLARTIGDQIRECETVLCIDASTPGLIDRHVRLVLVHAASDSDPSPVVADWRLHFPGSAIAIITDDLQKLQPQCHELFAAQNVQGILPLTLKLEVWLAAVSLLLSGGEYFPIADRRETPTVARPAPFRPTAPKNAWSATPAAVASPALQSLTNREQQILALLSEGHQNKVIAHKMSLSEHTVKVHVHNLLSKLRVTNRTQAAAAYRGGLTDALHAQALMHARGKNGSGNQPH